MLGLSVDNAKALIASEQAKGDKEDEGEEDDEEENMPEDFLGAVRKFIKDLEEMDAQDALRDFNLQVRFQGHVDTTPPDHLAAILCVFISEALGSVDLKAPKVQPGAVAKSMQGKFERW